VFPFRLGLPSINSGMPTVECKEIADGSGIRLAVGAASVQLGLMLEGELQITMTEFGGKLLRPVVGVRISDASGGEE